MSRSETLTCHQADVFHLRCLSLSDSTSRNIAFCIQLFTQHVQNYWRIASDDQRVLLTVLITHNQHKKKRANAFLLHPLFAFFPFMFVFSGANRPHIDFFPAGRKRHFQANTQINPDKHKFSFVSVENVQIYSYLRFHPNFSD